MVTLAKALIALPAVLLGIGFLAGVAFTLSLPWVRRWLERRPRRRGLYEFQPPPRPNDGAFYRGRRRAISTRES